MFIKLGKTIINTDQIATIEDDHVIVGMAKVTLEKDEIKQLLEAVLPKARAKKADEPKGELTELFKKINKLVGGSDRVVFSKKLQSHLNARLKEGFTEELFILAANNMMKNDFYKGVNDRNWKANAEWFIKDPEHINRFLDEPKKRGMFNG